jgi:cell wall-associated NlpC family hydrolase
MTVTPGTGGLNQVQLNNAMIIIGVGNSMQIPDFGNDIAIAVARQESRLHNLANDSIPESQGMTAEGSGHDHDSLGVFQQRASWGSVVARMDVATSARAFFTRLLTVKNWQKMHLTDAAQAVQISGSPEAYARWTVLAEQVVSTVTGAMPIGQCQDMIASDVSGKAGIAISKAEEALGTSYTLGGSCRDPHSVDPSLHCDCSSLVQTAWAAASVNLARTSEAQKLDPHVHLVAGATKENFITAVQPGNLIFYNEGETGPGPGHVALAIGSGMLIEAPQPGDVVHILKIYTSGFDGLGRVA